MNCSAPLCDKESAMSWQRWASADDLSQLKASGQVPQDTREGRLMVFGCEDHLLSPDAMAATHDATCTAPPTCTCDAL